MSIVDATPGGWLVHDHACVVHDGGEGWRDVVVEFLADGLDAGERAVYAAPKGLAAMAADLRALGPSDELVRSGQLVLVPLGPHLRADGTIDAHTQVATYRALLDEGRRAGFGAMRIASEATPLVRTSEQVRRFARYELLAGELFAGAPVACICGVEASALDPAELDLLQFVHNRHDAAGTPAHEVPGWIHADPRGGWQLAGHVDYATRAAFSLVLDALPVWGDLHLWLEALEFIDVAGVRSLVRMSRRLAPTAQIVLHSLPPGLRRILGIVADEVASTIRIDDG